MSIKMLKFLKILLHFLFALLISVLIIGYIPVKFAYKGDFVYDSTEYIICENIATTGFSWNKLNSEQSGQVIDLNKSIRHGFNQNLWNGSNQYVVYGKKIGTDDFYGDKYDIYSCDRWEILYPINRFSVLFDFPKSYICIFDLENPFDAFEFWFNNVRGEFLLGELK